MGDVPNEDQAEHAVGSSPRVFIHVGPPKTGTTFVQDNLYHWRTALAEQGIVLPSQRRHDDWLAALDVRGDHTAGFGAGGEVSRAGAEGAWQRLVRAVDGAHGTVVISQEILATADDAHAQEAMASFGSAEPHLVVTARDPERQLLSSFQQRIKNGHTHTFKKTVETISARRALHPSQRLPDVIRRWGSSLPPGHVHVVTVPQPGADPRILWDRFAAVIGFDASDCEPILGSSNTSLGKVQVELLRQVNEALDGRIPHPQYAHVVLRNLTHKVLAHAPDSTPFALDPQMWPVVDDMADEWVDFLTSGGFDIVGDLAELRPQHRPGGSPDESTARELADAAVWANAELLLLLAQAQPRRQPPRVRGVVGALGRRMRRSRSDSDSDRD
jgi:hypothetical protein